MCKLVSRYTYSYFPASKSIFVYLNRNRLAGGRSGLTPIGSLVCVDICPRWWATAFSSAAPDTRSQYYFCIRIASAAATQNCQREPKMFSFRWTGNYTSLFSFIGILGNSRAPSSHSASQPYLPRMLSHLWCIRFDNSVYHLDHSCHFMGIRYSLWISCKFQNQQLVQISRQNSRFWTFQANLWRRWDKIWVGEIQEPRSTAFLGWLRGRRQRWMNIESPISAESFSSPVGTNDLPDFQTPNLSLLNFPKSVAGWFDFLDRPAYSVEFARLSWSMGGSSCSLNARIFYLPDSIYSNIGLGSCPPNLPSCRISSLSSLNADLAGFARHGPNSFEEARPDLAAQNFYLDSVSLAHSLPVAQTLASLYSSGRLNGGRCRRRDQSPQSSWLDLFSYLLLVHFSTLHHLLNLIIPAPGLSANRWPFLESESEQLFETHFPSGLDCSPRWFQTDSGLSGLVLISLLEVPIGVGWDFECFTTFLIISLALPICQYSFIIHLWAATGWLLNSSIFQSIWVWIPSWIIAPYPVYLPCSRGLAISVCLLELSHQVRISIDPTCSHHVLTFVEPGHLMSLLLLKLPSQPTLFPNLSARMRGRSVSQAHLAYIFLNSPWDSHSLFGFLDLIYLKLSDQIFSSYSIFRNSNFQALQLHSISTTPGAILHSQQPTQPQPPSSSSPPSSWPTPSPAILSTFSSWNLDLSQTLQRALSWFPEFSSSRSPTSKIFQNRPRLPKTQIHRFQLMMCFSPASWMLRWASFGTWTGQMNNLLVVCALGFYAETTYSILFWWYNLCRLIINFKNLKQ